MKILKDFLYHKGEKMKYNVWFIIEKADDKNEIYKDLKDEQVLHKSFNSLKEARNYIKEND